MEPKTRYRIYDCGRLVPAYMRRPKNKNAELLSPRTIDEVKKGIKYYIPAEKMILIEKNQQKKGGENGNIINENESV